MADRKQSRIIEEAIRRSGVKAPSFSSKEYCFQKQLDFISDPSRFKTAVCSRRAGKTEGIAADLIDTCLNEDNVEVLYTTLTSRGARTIIWNKIKHILEDHKIDCKTDDTRLEVTFKNRSIIHLGGAKDETEIEKYRGWKLKKAYIDEAQAFRPYLKYFIEDILMPSLRDLRGSLSLTGTPGPVPAGPFFEIANNKKWNHHHWTAFDNPHMKDLEQTLAEEREVKGIDENDPGYIRETYGRWIEDFNSLVFKFSPGKNLWLTLPERKMDYIFGIDIGYVDSDAIAVLGYSYADRNVYLIEERIQNKQDITALVEQIKVLQAKYSPVKMVMDAGALGKKIQAEIVDRHGLFIEAAEKTRKLEFIELLNDDLRNGRFKAFGGSRFQQDSTLVQWDRSSYNKPKISDIYHSDITDAVLYGWRECRHYFAKPEQQGPKPGTPEFFKMMDAKLEAEEEEKFKKAGQISDFNEEIDLNSKEFWEE
jgi:hypothetical protein